MGVPIEWPVARCGDRLFFQRRVAGQDQPVLYATSATDPAALVELLVDPAALAADGAVALDWVAPSRDGALVAFGLSEGGTENSTLHVGDERIPNTRACSLSWLPDASGFLYTRYPEGDQYNRHVYRHALGTHWHDDECVFDRLPVSDAWPSVSVHKAGSHVLVSVGVGWSRTDIHLYDCVAKTWTVVIEGVEANTSLGFDGARLYGTTDLDAPRGRVIDAPIDDPTAWRTIIPESELVIESAWRNGDDLWVSGLRRAVRELHRHSLDGTHIERVELPALAELSGATGDHDHAELFIGCASFALPSRIYRWTPGAGLAPWGPDPDLPFDPTSIRVRQVTYPSLDGTPIGLFLVHRTDLTPMADTPCWLGGYGGFNIASTPGYSASIAAWCESGGLYALAGLRGGNEEGEEWHRAGMRGQKQNVFDDFHAAADWLVGNGLTNRERLAIRGGSNGGLLVGAALTQRPDLCQAVVCEVPLLDMLRYPQFLIARLWTHEYGDPDMADEFEWLLGYSPYHHVVQGRAYPQTLMITAEGDTRVDPLHARKMAALLEWAGSPVRFKQEGRSGHGAGKPVSKLAADAADVLAFVSGVLGHQPR